MIALGAHGFPKALSSCATIWLDVYMSRFLGRAKVETGRLRPKFWYGVPGFPALSALGVPTIGTGRPRFWVRLLFLRAIS